MVERIVQILVCSFGHAAQFAGKTIPHHAIAVLENNGLVLAGEDVSVAAYVCLFIRRGNTCAGALGVDACCWVVGSCGSPIYAAPYPYSFMF
jgi:hypothetical protein